MLRKYKIKLLSRLRTPLQSDTIFGHLCWGIRYIFGEKELTQFLAEMEKEPLIKISSAFPKDHLPRPILPSPKREEIRNLAKVLAGKAQNEQEALFLGLSKLKKIRKRRYIPVSLWKDLRKNMDEISLLKGLAKHEKEPSMKQIIHPHNTISREKGTVLEEGGLYFEREWWIDPESSLDLYVWFKNEDVKHIWDTVWKRYIEPSGFGKDKSTGAGQIQIFEEEFDQSIFHLENANSWMSLSLLGFHKFPSCDTFYSPILKFGKLGEDYAVSSPTGGAVNPFKKLLIMLEPGSVFKAKEPPTGELLKNVHKDTSIRHYGYGLFLPFYLKE